MVGPTGSSHKAFLACDIFLRATLATSYARSSQPTWLHAPCHAAHHDPDMAVIFKCFEEEEAIVEVPEDRAQGEHEERPCEGSQAHGADSMQGWQQQEAWTPSDDYAR